MRGSVLFSGPKDAMSRLHEAARNGNVTELRMLLLSPDVEINCQDGHDWTALMTACQAGSYECVRVLLIAGADVNHMTKGGESALVRAVAMCHGDIVRLLLMAGANPNFQTTNYEQTCLHAATMFGDEPCVRHLLAYGANPNLRDEEGRRAIDYANKDNIKALLVRSEALSALDQYARLVRTCERKGMKTK